jgi:Tol biopolymer transport system component
MAKQKGAIKRMRINLLIAFLVTLYLMGCKDNPTEPTEPQPIKNKVLKTNEVVFFSSDMGGKATNIFMMTPKGEIIKQVTKYDWGEYVVTAISPDSNQLLFYQANPGLGIDVGMDIYIYKIKEDTILGPITNGHPGNFSPSGNEFVFHRHTFTMEGGYESIYSYDLHTNTEKKLTEDGKTSFFPKISPDGNYICYESASFLDTLSYWQLHLMDINGNYITYLTMPLSAYYAGDPVYTPDGMSIIFRYEERALCFDICKIDIATKEIEYLTKGYNGNNFYNPYVNSSNYIYFHSKKYDPYPNLVTEIYGIDLSGNNFKQITNNGHWNSNPVAGKVSYYIEE